MILPDNPTPKDIAKFRHHLPKPGQTNTTGKTALMLLAGEGLTDLVREYAEYTPPVKKGVQQPNPYLKAKDTETGATALIIATKHRHTEAAAILTKYEAGIRDSYGRTALIYAAIDDNIELVALLMDAEKTVVDKSGMTALMYAASKGNLQTVKLLAPLEKGIHTRNHLNDTREQREETRRSITAQRIAVMDEIACSLLDHMGGPGGLPPMHPTHSPGFPAETRRSMMLSSIVDGPLPRSTRASIDSVGIRKSISIAAESLAEDGKAVESAASYTALMLAAREHHPMCVKVLIDYEAGIKDQIFEQTALMKCLSAMHKFMSSGFHDDYTSVYAEFYQCASILIQKGGAKGELGIVDMESRTALQRVLTLPVDDSNMEDINELIQLIFKECPREYSLTIEGCEIREEADLIEVLKSLENHPPVK